MQADSIWLNLAAFLPAILAAMVVSGVLGLVFERVIVRPVYGQHLKQILVTTGGLIVAEQLLKVVWGPDQITARAADRAARRLPVRRRRDREVSPARRRRRAARVRRAAR